VLESGISNYNNILRNNDLEVSSILLNRFYDMFAKVIEKYAGRIDKNDNGKIRVFFGAPVASENSQKEAVNAAIEIRNNIDEINSNQTIPIELKIGIDSGTVIAGTIGTEGNKNYTVFGKPVNNVTQYLNKCNVSQILVGSQTYKLTKNEFKYNESPSLLFANSNEELKIYDLLSEREIVSRPRLAMERQIYSKMVGRDNELETIRSRIIKLIDGQGIIINLIGEAGIGKSRLKVEFRNLEEIKNVTLLEGRSLSIGKSLSFHPLTDIMKNWAGIAEDDKLSESHRKLENLIFDIYPQNAEEVFPFVATMMGIKLSGKFAERITGIKGDALERLIQKNFRDFFGYASRQNPIIFVMEDLHWADATSIEFLNSLYRLAQDNPIMFVNIFRPNYENSRMILDSINNRYNSLYSNIYLDALDDKYGNSLINNLISIENIDTRIIDLIYTRSGGNPFFIEEIIRSLIDEGAIVKRGNNFTTTDKIHTISIPETINEVIMCRVDRLDPTLKSILKKASIIGRNFFDKILTEVADDADNIQKRLEQLENIQLLRKHIRMEETEYLFKHAITHETVYNSILISDRKKLHIKAAEAYEKVFSKNLTKFYGILSDHYMRGEDLDRAELYLIKAGHEALKSSASNEAIDFYKNALDLYLNQYQGKTNLDKKVDLEYNIAMALQYKGRYIDSFEYFERINEKYQIIPQNKFLFSLKFIYGFVSLLVGVYFPRLKWRKPIDEKTKKEEQLFYDYQNSTGMIDPIRG
ncbi:MAG: AAA family ATPase, partial [Melioribacteraceae bacterium]|nr:AAA family ATPase [Melioribacteraceae bacterium]